MLVFLWLDVLYVKNEPTTTTSEAYKANRTIENGESVSSSGTNRRECSFESITAVPGAPNLHMCLECWTRLIGISDIRDIGNTSAWRATDCEDNQKNNVVNIDPRIRRITWKCVDVIVVIILRRHLCPSMVTIPTNMPLQMKDNSMNVISSWQGRSYQALETSRSNAQFITKVVCMKLLIEPTKLVGHRWLSSKASKASIYQNFRDVTQRGSSSRFKQPNQTSQVVRLMRQLNSKSPAWWAEMTSLTSRQQSISVSPTISWLASMTAEESNKWTWFWSAHSCLNENKRPVEGQNVVRLIQNIVRF